MAHFHTAHLPSVSLGLCLFAASVAIPVRSATAEEGTSKKEAADDDNSSPSSRFDKLVARARQAYDRENWEAAARAFEQAYELKKVHNLLYNIGRVHEEAGRFGKAVSYYQKFVNKPGINLEHRKDALERIETLKQVADLEDDETSEPSSSDPSANREAPQGGPSGAVSTRNDYTLAIVFLSIGGASLVGGTTFGVLTSNTHSTFEDATSRSTRRTAADRGQTFGTIADVLFISGGLLTATGLGFVIWPPRKEVSSSRARLRPTLSPRKVGVQLDFEF